MMKRCISLAVAFAAAAAAPLCAQQQTSDCPLGGTTPTEQARRLATQDGCQQAIDLFRFMIPQLGVAMTGGNATLGQGGTLGGLGHFTIGVRANVIDGTVPRVDQVTLSATGAVQRTSYPTQNQVLGLPVVDGSVGLFRGFPLGVTNIGGVDLLLNASYVPTYHSDGVAVDPDSPLRIGYGIRLGLIEESLVTPGIGFTFLKRDLPTTTITGTASGVQLVVRDLDVETYSWRLVAAKNLFLLGIAVGFGQDSYEASTSAQANYSGAVFSDVIAMKEDLTRTNVFADVSLNFVIAKIVGEVGMASGGTVTTFNQFTTAPDQSRAYASVGLRIGF